MASGSYPGRVGVDLVDVAEFRAEFMSREDVLTTMFTERESAYCRASADPAQSFAARWAAKEGVVKAFGTGWVDEIDYTDIEIVNDENGAPQIVIRGGASDFCERNGVKRLEVSLSHLPNLAISMVSICCC